MNSWSLLNREYWFGERKNLRIYVFLFSIFLLLLMIPTVYAFLWVESINIEPQDIESLTINRTYGKIFNLRIWSINGTYDNSINIWVTNPNGDTILNLGNVRVTNHSKDFEFLTWQDGVYTLYFDNSFSSSPKTVEYMHWTYEDTLLPAYYIAIAMWLILPPLVKYFLGYDWMKTIVISLVVVAVILFLLGSVLYKEII